MKQTSAGAMTLIASSVLATAVHAGTLFTIKETSEGETKLSRLWIDQGRYRLESIHGDDMSMEIFNDGKLYLLNFNDDTYTVLDRDNLAKSAETHRRMTGQSSRPEAVRELRSTEQVRLSPGGECRVWQVLLDSELTQEMCILPLRALRTGNQIRKTMDSYNELLAEFDATTPSMSWSDVETTEGIPLVVTTFADGKIHSNSITLSISTNEFTTPQTYELPRGMREGSKF